MASSTLTSKGQMTLPKEIRDRLALKPGDRLEVTVENSRIILTPKTLGIEDLCRVLPPAERPRSIQEMEAAIRRRSVQSR